MVSKRGFVIFSLLLIGIFLLNFANSASCSITTSCAPANTVMKLSDVSNAHGELYNQGNYNYYLCCDVTGTHTCSGSNKILGLSAPTNAHAELLLLTNYNYDVCFGTFSCTSVLTSSSCPAEFPIWTVSLSDSTNAHIGVPYVISGSNEGYNICCKDNPASVCGDGLLNPATEQCDDGNLIDGDGCSNTCTIQVCDLTSATWNITGTVPEGRRVGLNVQGTNCIGKQISFTVEEYDSLGGNDPVNTNPQNIILNGSGGGQGTWIAEWQTEGWPETNPPEYIFTASVIGTSETITSSTSSSLMLRVNPAVCGDGIIQGTETCDDGNTANGDGCSSTCTIELPCDLTSLKWNISSVIEGSPVKINVKGTTGCAGKEILFIVQEYDYLSYDPVNTNPSNIILNNSGMGSGIWTAEWQEDLEQYEDSNNIPEYLVTAYVVGTWSESISSLIPRDSLSLVSVNNTYIPPTCIITSAEWSLATVKEGSPVALNIQTSNCQNGQLVSFVVEEYDSGALDGNDPVEINPSSVQILNNAATGTWIAEWQNDDGGIFSSEVNPPEYIFTAQVSGQSPVTSNNPKLNVTRKATPEECIGIGYCSNYQTESQCSEDICEVGDESVPSTITCGRIFNPNTRCFDIISCGCNWNSGLGVCESNWDPSSECGICGNGVQDYGELCDDGNLINGDGCSSTCNFESNITSPCPEGLTLCSDGTCSLNCVFTDTDVSNCNYNSVCEAGEGCTCMDCNNQQDACINGLLCSIFDTACCTSESNGACNPYCSFADPDCIPSVCGNGYEETGEECDMGVRNGQINSGCLDNCTYEIIIPTTGCPEGTSLCSDGTCSINCYETDRGIDEYDPLTCESGLLYSIEDMACCNEAIDYYCNPYCSYADLDCRVEGMPESISIGKCTYTENSADTCEDDGRLVRSLVAQWIWGIGNSFITNPDGESYWQPEGTGAFRYDPFDFSLKRKSQQCANIEDIIICPAQIEIPFFNIYNFALAIILIILIYLLYSLKKKKKNKKRK